MLNYLLDPNDSERAFVPFAKTDTVALMINNLGGLSTLELSALAHVTLTLLNSKWNIQPVRVYQGALCTSLSKSHWLLNNDSTNCLFLQTVKHSRLLW